MIDRIGMSVRRGSGVLALFVASAAGAQQRQTESVSAATRAQAIVSAAVDAMGGLAALQAIEDVTREMSGDRSDAGQGAHPVASSVVDPPVINHPTATSILDV